MPEFRSKKGIGYMFAKQFCRSGSISASAVTLSTKPDNRCRNCAPRLWRRWHWLLLVGLLSAAVGGGGTASAAAPTPVTIFAGQAAWAVEPVFSFGADVAAVPVAIGNVLRLPLGVVECAFFPVPGFGIVSGLTNVGSGVKGCFELVFAVLKLPLSAVTTMRKLGNSGVQL